jgi:hypothetical protein
LVAKSREKGHFCPFSCINNKDQIKSRMNKISVQSLNECFNIGGEDFIWDDDNDHEVFTKPIFFNRGSIGFTHSKESKRKMSQSAKGNKRCLGRVMSEETRRKIGEANAGRVSHWKGKKQPADAVEKMKQTKRMKGDNVGANNPRAKTYQITFDDGTIVVTKSLQTWAKENGIPTTSLRNFYNGTGLKKYRNIVGVAPLTP